MENIFFDLKRLKYLGKGAIIGRTVRIRHPELVSIGDGTIIDDFTYISAAVEIGRCCHIASNVVISGGAGHLRIGDFVGVAAATQIHTCSSSYAWVSLDLPSVPEEHRYGGIKGTVELADHVLIGAQSIILPNVKLPEGTAGGARSMFAPGSYREWTLYDGTGPQNYRITKRRGAEQVKAVAARVLEQYGS